jgi:hypothetical protein
MLSLRDEGRVINTPDVGHDETAAAGLAVKRVKQPRMSFVGRPLRWDVHRNIG